MTSIDQLIESADAAAARMRARAALAPVPVITLQLRDRPRRPRHRANRAGIALTQAEFVVMGVACSALGGMLAFGLTLVAGGWR